MNLRYVDWIWHVRGSLPLPVGQSGDEALDRLDPLFRQYGTSHERTAGTLSFRKKDQESQDKMSVFDSGVLRIEQRAGGGVLRYDLVSRTLLFCFLAPLLFLGFAQATKAIAAYEKHRAEAAGKKPPKPKKPAAAPAPLNPIDKFLGAPAPEAKKPKKDEGGGGDGEGGGKKPTPTPAYVFACIFATLYVVGRILEDRLVRSLFRRSLMGGSGAGPDDRPRPAS